MPDLCHSISLNYTSMKNIYLFEYSFDNAKGKSFDNKTFVIVKDTDFENPPTVGEMETIACYKFHNKFPHVDMQTVKFSVFNGDIIDLYSLSA